MEGSCVALHDFFYGLVCVESMKMGLLGVWQGVVLGG